MEEEAAARHTGRLKSARPDERRVTHETRGGDGEATHHVRQQDVGVQCVGQECSVWGRSLPVGDEVCSHSPATDDGEVCAV